MSDVAEDHEPRVPLRVARKGDLRRGRVLLIGTLAFAATILATVFVFTKPKVIYSRGVSELLKQPLLGTTVRLEGFLVRGSLCKVPSTCEFRFRVEDSPYRADGPRDELEVRYEDCLIPDTLRDVPGYECSLTMEGELRADRRHFDAKFIMVKCPGKYEVPPDGWAHAAPSPPVPPCP